MGAANRAAGEGRRKADLRTAAVGGAAGLVQAACLESPIAWWPRSWAPPD